MIEYSCLIPFYLHDMFVGVSYILRTFLRGVFEKANQQPVRGPVVFFFFYRAKPRVSVLGSMLTL